MSTQREKPDESRVRKNCQHGLMRRGRLEDLSFTLLSKAVLRLYMPFNTDILSSGHIDIIIVITIMIITKYLERFNY